jgi:hypothetical protein
VPNAEAFGQDANGNVSYRCTLDGQQCLMLLRIEPDFRGFVLTELQTLSVTDRGNLNAIYILIRHIVCDGGT